MKIRASSTTSCLRIQESSFGKETVNILPFRASFLLSLPQQQILGSLALFYTAPCVGSVLHPYATQQSDISLRLLDWLVRRATHPRSLLARAPALPPPGR